MKRLPLLICLLIPLVLLPGPAASQGTMKVSHISPDSGVLSLQPAQRNAELNPVTSRALTGRLLLVYSAQELANGVFVGSEFCLACHAGKATWRDTKHAQALRRPMTQWSLVPGKGVVADYDSNGVDDFIQGLNFNDISSVFNPFKPNAPILSVEGGTYFITLGALKMPVISTQGGTGDWKQRYLVRVPVSGTADGLSDENYVSPVQYNEATHEYVLYHPEAWYDAGNQPRFGPGSSAAQLAAENNRTYSKRCIGCHTTGTRALGQTAAGEYTYTPYSAILFDPDDPAYLDYDHDGVRDLVNIGCEACHGPGSAHILAGGDPSLIVNPEELDTPAANAVCGQCHSRVKSVPDGLYDWPFKDDLRIPFTAGRSDIEDFFTDASGRWPDGINSRQHHQQWLDFLESPKPGFQFHPVKCFECHEPHGGVSNQRLIRDVLEEDGLDIPTRVADNSLCLACHAGFGPFRDLTKAMIADIDEHQEEIARAVAPHTNHPYVPARIMGLSRCVECHMPKIATSAVPFDIRSHTFEAISPEKTLIYQAQGGMPSSCAASCHSLKVNLFGFGIDPNLGIWNEPFDRQTAEELSKYFGPGGLWWDTTEAGSTAEQALSRSAQPGEVLPIPKAALDD